MLRSGVRFVLWGLCALGGAGALVVFAMRYSEPVGAAPVNIAPKKTLQAFNSDAELEQLLAKYKGKARRGLSGALEGGDSMAFEMAAPAAPMAAAKAESKDKAADSVTNTQTAGVDEGDIVKVHGKHLVVLRRGRLFTVDIGSKPGDAVKPVSAIPAYGPDMQPSSWYDEMLLSGNTIVVISYSYQRNATEIGLFDIDDAGRLSYRDTYYLRSNDYYSSRNYASRLIGDKLIFYTPLALNYYGNDPFASFPALDRWQGKNVPADFKRIAPANRIYRADGDLASLDVPTLHTVQICDLSKREMTCTATGVLGPYGSEFYVSADSVYIWTVSYPHSDQKSTDGNYSAVYRLPLNGSAPSMLKTAGSPIDQFSFLQSDDGYLNVLLRDNGYGGRMWASEKSGDRGGVAMMRVALNQFSDGRDAVPDNAYRSVPRADGGQLQNRFIGDWLLYGAGNSWGDKADKGSNLYAVRWAKPETPIAQVILPHGVERIEALGGNAVAVGSRGNDLLFTSVSLSGNPSVAGQYVRRNAAQGETRSHGFFYRADDRDHGVLGLPIIGGGESAGWNQLSENSAAILFLRNTSLRLSELGALVSDGKAADDNCLASCVDWYGNARPLFLRGRVFALMGYELVEGRIDGERIREVQRASFAPTVRIRQ